MEAYRRFYVADILPWKVAEFLIFEDSFPRSILFCVQQLDDFVHLISETPKGEYRTDGERRLGRLLNTLSFTTADDVFKEGLHEFVTRCQEEISALGEYVYQTYMYHAPVDMDAEIRFHQQQEQQQQQQ